MAAKENQLEEHGYAGDLVHDETKIQKGVALDMSSGCPKLIGWIDTGEENLHAKFLKEKPMKSTLATHVLQVMFVGYTGYRFPVCHYPTCGVKASELHTILCSTIKKLHDWGFFVDYILCKTILHYHRCFRYWSSLYLVNKKIWTAELK